MAHPLSAFSQINFRSLAATDVRKNFYQIFKSVSEEQEIGKVINKKTGKSAFFINEEDFLSVMETLYLVDSGTLEELLAAKQELLSEGTNLEQIKWPT